MDMKRGKFKNHLCQKHISVFFTKCADKIIILSLMVLIIGASCATQHKYRKYKAIPCPCETQQKRR
jgi:hypothetical protein